MSNSNLYKKARELSISWSSTSNEESSANWHLECRPFMASVPGHCLEG